MAFTVVTYNILATAYIRPEWYPHTPPAMLAPAHRVPALVRRVVALDADVLCLQEVESDVFAALETSLAPRGYAGTLARKARRRPDGCATFFRREVFAPIEVARLPYRDGDPPSGHVAQIAVLQHDGRRLGVANTHLRWDPPGTSREQQWGHRQVRELLGGCDARSATGWIVCGDLNVPPESDVVAALRAAGLEHAHGAWPRMYTCNSNATAKTIDYLFHSAALCATPQPVSPVDDRTPLPGADHPSDHVPVEARFEWAS